MPEPHRIEEQNEAYRKGLVLGLTMAEVGILIIFVLLLLLIFVDIDRAQQQLKVRDLPRLIARDSVLAEVSRAMSDGTAPPDDDFTKLVRVLREIAQSREGKNQLAEATSTLQSIRAARVEMEKMLAAGKDSGAAVLDRKLEELPFRIANQQGQLKALENKLVALGLGKGERPCWVQPNGTIDFLYDVVLGTEGIRLREREYPTRARERELLPAPHVNEQEVLSESAFLERTRPLFRRSVENNCRYFVVIYDATGPAEKERYKGLLRTVESHFYKRLAESHAPF